MTMSFNFFYMCIAKMFHLTGTAWDEVLKLNTKLFRAKHCQGEFFRVLFSDRNSSGCCFYNTAQSKN